MGWKRYKDRPSKKKSFLPVGNVSSSFFGSSDYPVSAKIREVKEKKGRRKERKVKQRRKRLKIIGGKGETLLFLLVVVDAWQGFQLLVKRMTTDVANADVQFEQ